MALGARAIMHIFISYSSQDKVAVGRIAERLRADGHDVWIDSLKLRPGDNLQRKVQEGLNEADALIVVVSENSRNSRWVQHEFAAIAFQQISRGERRIIPVRLDKAEVPSYLADRVFLDLSENFEAGLTRLSETLREGAPPPALRDPAQDDETRAAQIANLRNGLRKGRLTLVCGAGVSIQAGIPDWSNLLVRLLERMMDRISKDHSLNIGKKAAAYFQRAHGSSSLILGKYLKNNLGRDFPSEMRAALYSAEPTSSILIGSIATLSRPQRDGRPLDSIITFNFDCLIEENLTAKSIRNKPIYSEAIQHDPSELPVYHVHGYLPRSGRIPADSEMVFSEDAYHSQFIDPFSWSNLIQLTKLTQSTCLFVGISLTDPNMRRLLDVAWRKNPDKKRGHYIIKRIPFLSDGVLDEVSKLLEEQDANALGLNVVWVKGWDEIPLFLNAIAAESQN
jgi:hypothetical protein